MVQPVMQRLEFLDAARGLAIFTVVYSHLCLFCLPAYQFISLLAFGKPSRNAT